MKLKLMLIICLVVSSIFLTSCKETYTSPVEEINTLLISLPLDANSEYLYDNMDTLKEKSSKNAIDTLEKIEQCQKRLIENIDGNIFCKDEVKIIDSVKSESDKIETHSTFCMIDNESSKANYYVTIKYDLSTGKYVELEVIYLV